MSMINPSDKLRFGQKSFGLVSSFDRFDPSSLLVPINCIIGSDFQVRSCPKTGIARFK